MWHFKQEEKYIYINCKSVNLHTTSRWNVRFIGSLQTFSTMHLYSPVSTILLSLIISLKVLLVDDAFFEKILKKKNNLLSLNFVIYCQDNYKILNIEIKNILKCLEVRSFICWSRKTDVHTCNFCSVKVDCFLTML